jgi:hypothetical protein
LLGSQIYDAIQFIRRTMALTYDVVPKSKLGENFPAARELR